MSHSRPIVVEVRSSAPPRDWPELSSLLRVHLSQTLSRSLELGLAFPFPPGKCIRWDTAAPPPHPDKESGGDIPVPLPQPQLLLRNAIQSVRVCDMTDPGILTRGPLPSRTVGGGGGGGSAPHRVSFLPVFSTLQTAAICEDSSSSASSAEEDNDNSGGLPSCSILCLPHTSLEGLWESLSYGESVPESIAMKRDLVEYVQSALIFSLAGVDVHRVTWNRMVLLHGPPGTGKTSLCKALAHKLATRLCGHTSGGGGCGTSSDAQTPIVTATAAAAAPLFKRSMLVEINAHSLFSRWFSESGKQVLQLFTRIRALAADPRCLVCVLIDEVESLAAARQSAMKGNEPSDSIRVVNALLTQMDSLQHSSNVLVLATSNLTGGIDVAFLDRADKKVFVGPPGIEARRTILQAAIAELVGKGLVHFTNGGGGGGDEDGCDDTYNSRVNNDEEEEAEEAQYSSSFAAGLSSTCSGGGSHHGVGSSSLATVEATTALLDTIAAECVGFNGRLLKRLPFLAYGACLSANPGAAAAAAAAMDVSSSSSTTTATADAAARSSGASVARALKPGYIGAHRTCSPAAVSIGAAKAAAAAAVGGGGRSNAHAGEEEKHCAAAVPSLPGKLYLWHLREAARREVQSKKSIAATHQHFTSD